MNAAGRDTTHLGRHHAKGTQNVYDDSYDNAPVSTGAGLCTDAACENQRHNHGQRKHHGAMAGAGVGAAAGGAAGVAAGEHMHHHDQQYGAGHNYGPGQGPHHTRGGNIGNGPDMVGSGTTGDAMDNGGSVGGGAGSAAAPTENLLAAEADNNFPGTNPHPGHSALNTRGGHGGGLGSSGGRV